MTSSLQDVTWDGSCARFEAANGDPLYLIGLAFNAAISAVEARVLAYPDALDFREKLGKGPLVLKMSHPTMPVEETHAIHFEDARLAFPAEIREADQAVCAVFVLRGIRVESTRTEKR